MKKRKLFAVLSACLMLTLSYGSAASAAVITFDKRPQLELMKLPGPGQVAKPNGTYIAAGSSNLTEIGPGYVRIGATTSCYRQCALVDARAVLYQVNGSNYQYQTEVYGNVNDTYDMAVSKDWHVERQKYYQVQSGHNVKAYDGTVETQTSWTDLAYVS